MWRAHIGPLGGHDGSCHQRLSTQRCAGLGAGGLVLSFEHGPRRRGHVLVTPSHPVIRCDCHRPLVVTVVFTAEGRHLLVLHFGVAVEEVIDSTLDQLAARLPRGVIVAAPAGHLLSVSWVHPRAVDVYVVVARHDTTFA
eukprot:2234251-Prymnesium_polylepis.1